MPSIVHALTPVEIQTGFYGYCTEESAFLLSPPAAGTLTPDRIKGKKIASIGTQNAFFLFVEIVGDLAQDFFDSIETTQFGTLNTASADDFFVDTFNTEQAVTRWGWVVNENFNNLGVARDVTFTFTGGGGNGSNGGSASASLAAPLAEAFSSPLA